MESEFDRDTDLRALESKHLWHLWYMFQKYEASSVKIVMPIAIPYGYTYGYAYRANGAISLPLPRW